MSATDKDAGNNGKITYSISGSSPQSAKETFSIDGNNGNLNIDVVFRVPKSGLFESWKALSTGLRFFEPL